MAAAGIFPPRQSECQINQEQYQQYHRRTHPLLRCPSSRCRPARHGACSRHVPHAAPGPEAVSGKAPAAATNPARPRSSPPRAPPRLRNLDPSGPTTSGSRRGSSLGLARSARIGTRPIVSSLFPCLRRRLEIPYLQGFFFCSSTGSTAAGVKRPCCEYVACNIQTSAGLLPPPPMLRPGLMYCGNKMSTSSSHRFEIP